MQKRVLLFHEKESLKPIGGPCGYLNSLNVGLVTVNSDDISFFFLPQTIKGPYSNIRKRISKNFIINKIKPIYQVYKHYRFINNIINGESTINIDLSKYDAIHFHTTMDLYMMRKKLKNYDGEIILTSHSPVPLSMEIIDNACYYEKRIFHKVYANLIEMDRYSFERADYIIFPCETADEPYLKMWPEYKQIKKKKEASYRYLLTGTVPAKIYSSRSRIRENYNIPKKAFVISYVGRHNYIKGFERLKQIGKKVLEMYPDLYFLIGGEEIPINGLKHERWIEVGWTDCPHSLTNASDLFILPNKETYFDLILLEVLSIGIPIIASYTGGNKYFKGQKGIQLFESDNECIDLIRKVMCYTDSEKNKIKELNCNLYKQKFSPDIFAKNYISILESILE